MQKKNYLQKNLLTKKNYKKNLKKNLKKDQKIYYFLQKKWYIYLKNQQKIYKQIP